MIIYYPVFTDLPELIHHYYSARYFLPEDNNTRILFFVSEKLREQVGDTSELVPPVYMGDCSWSKDVNINVNFTNKKIDLLKLLFRYRTMDVLVWSAVTKAASKVAVNVMGPQNAVNIDRYSTWGCFEYPKYKYDHVPSLRRKVINNRHLQHRKFLDYVETLPVYSKAYIFGTGPSVENAFDYDFSDGYRIVCNTIVKNRVLMDYIKPHFMTAGDGIYHFGISRYACKFREDLEKFLITHKCLFLIPEFYYENFMFHHVKMNEFTAAIPSSGVPINLMLKEKFEVRSLPNILNLILLPLASSLSDNIFLLGFDGRGSNDKHFWKSVNSVNYEDLKEFHQNAHPGFFRGVDHVQYAEVQGEVANKIMSLGETMGKKYYCLNKSTNQALQKRYLSKEQYAVLSHGRINNK